MFTLWITPITNKIKKGDIINSYYIIEGMESEESKEAEDLYIPLWVDSEYVIFEPVFTPDFRREYHYDRKDFR